MESLEHWDTVTAEVLQRPPIWLFLVWTAVGLQIASDLFYTDTEMNRRKEEEHAFKARGTMKSVFIL